MSYNIQSLQYGVESFCLVFGSGKSRYKLSWSVFRTWLALLDVIDKFKFSQPFEPYSEARKKWAFHQRRVPVSTWVLDSKSWPTADQQAEMSNPCPITPITIIPFPSSDAPSPTPAPSTHCRLVKSVSVWYEPASVAGTGSNFETTAKLKHVSCPRLCKRP
jgi:hypothetical protein